MPFYILKLTFSFICDIVINEVAVMKISSIHALWPEKQGFVLERNYTEGYYVFIHFLSNVRFKDNEVILPGGCIFYKPYSYRYFSADSEALLHDWFHAYGDIDILLKKYGLEFNKVYYPNDNSITKIIKELEVENLMSRSFSESFTNIKLEELVLKIARGIEAPLPADTSTYKRFLKLRSYIQTNYASLQNVEDLCNMVNLSPSRFYVLYKKIFNISPKKDLINTKIEHAKLLLKQKKYSVLEIAEATGYQNEFHFIRQFKERTGATPLEYSKKF